ncbi:hypothetical protein LTS08_001546 [Lithohypha guttulata]|uniref:uncharacterized protein n=1 Tax=Lithohypha guttulata TaxID=1690604 RepID=UPI002DE1CA07|nr:hypothetical protein LTR51_003787 [Lithohypha guttulata]KAK5105271.1 hypothetical protein LTS08_001546 [Lithohypha guttulata]
MSMNGRADAVCGNRGSYYKVPLLGVLESVLNERDDDCKACDAQRHAEQAISHHIETGTQALNEMAMSNQGPDPDFFAQREFHARSVAGKSLQQIENEAETLYMIMKDLEAQLEARKQDLANLRHSQQAAESYQQAMVGAMMAAPAQTDRNTRARFYYGPVTPEEVGFRGADVPIQFPGNMPAGGVGLWHHLL